MTTKTYVLAFTALLGLGASVSAQAAKVEVTALLDTYRGVHRALFTDAIDKASEQGGSLHALASQWLTENPSHVQVPNITLLAKGGEALSQAKTDAQARKAFVDVAKGVVQFMRVDTSLQTEWQLFFCPMAPEFGYWVQPKNESLANPYFGQEMPTCGQKKKWTPASRSACAA